MASQLQNRLVGSVILIALAVIILPELLDGKPPQQQEQFETIPLQPEVAVTSTPVAEIPTEQLPPSLDDVATVELTADTAPTLNQSAPASSTPAVAQPPSAAALKESGWVIQLGAFRNQQSVDQLVAELQAAGYAAYREQVAGSQGPLHKLMVGPKLVKSELEQDLPKLKQITSLNGKVVRYQP
ncbi:SPOR domain-containing protein [Pseudidiomarina sp. WS423]|uniref:SPOR domain-containing protein n=1 Tax=Pseudidiomarina sp. WS423 TaxID=3425124 RepID=UPI003D6F43F6